MGEQYIQNSVLFGAVLLLAEGCALDIYAGKYQTLPYECCSSRLQQARVLAVPTRQILCIDIQEVLGAVVWI